MKQSLRNLDTTCTEVSCLKIKFHKHAVLADQIRFYYEFTILFFEVFVGSVSLALGYYYSIVY